MGKEKGQKDRGVVSTWFIGLADIDFNFPNKSCIYDSLLKDDIRSIITRWRLSNHDLMIEIGRYSGILRNERLCGTCDILEDEHHVIFQCPRYEIPREDYSTLLNKNNSVAKFLNPAITDCCDTALFLQRIEKIRNK